MCIVCHPDYCYKTSNLQLAISSLSEHCFLVKLLDCMNELYLVITILFCQGLARERGLSQLDMFILQVIKEKRVIYKICDPTLYSFVLDIYIGLLCVQLGFSVLTFRLSGSHLNKKL